jgi:Domain of unknown function (DUF1851)
MRINMFDKFKDSFIIDSCLKQKIKKQSNSLKNLKQTSEINNFFDEFEGTSLEKGLYRIHETGNIDKWTSIVENAFPDFKDKIVCFAYDWLGRQFAICTNPVLNDNFLVIRFDVGSGIVYETMKNFLDFHNCEVIEHCENNLDSTLFFDWLDNNSPLNFEKCLSYKIPLFLGGEKDLSNIELSNMELYWDLFGQILKQVKILPSGSKITKISIK